MTVEALGRSMKTRQLAQLRFRPLTRERWKDFETLFGERGACGGCWCMYWRLSRSEFEKRKGAGNRSALREIVRSGHSPGILAYAGKLPVGWCAIGPRQAYATLGRSRVLAPVDDERVWSVVCFFVERPWRRLGVATRLLEAAVRFANRYGARIVEGYPVDPRKGRVPDVFAWTGLAGSFRQAGFREVLRRSPTRPIMRLRCR